MSSVGRPLNIGQSHWKQCVVCTTVAYCTIVLPCDSWTYSSRAPLNQKFARRSFAISTEPYIRTISFFYWSHAVTTEVFIVTVLRPIAAQPFVVVGLQLLPCDALSEEPVSIVSHVPSRLPYTLSLTDRMVSMWLSICHVTCVSSQTRDIAWRNSSSLWFCNQPIWTFSTVALTYNDQQCDVTMAM